MGSLRSFYSKTLDPYNTEITPRIAGIFSRMGVQVALESSLPEITKIRPSIRWLSTKLDLGIKIGSLEQRHNLSTRMLKMELKLQWESWIIENSVFALQRFPLPIRAKWEESLFWNNLRNPPEEKFSNLEIRIALNGSPLHHELIQNLKQTLTVVEDHALIPL